MPRLLLTLTAAFLLFSASAQKTKTSPAPQPKKTYPSLLWEITGNGLTKPSYLFGTMHVSNKLAFHLGDSFYNAMKRVDVVALETNPEFWQEDFSRSPLMGNKNIINNLGRMFGEGASNNYLSISSFAFEDFNDKLKAALAMEPSIINGLLYRTAGAGMQDFEEDTYLDLYIFQAGKKLGKRLTSVENFEESEQLVIEAYTDMMKDKNRKERSYDYQDAMANPKRIEEAYRKGDLDLLDSLQALYTMSDAFQEKFLYKRNEIQAKSIDTILKKQSLFAAVGAAHLPGKRGVIEMLRDMGYKLRPVRMDQRNSVQKESLDKMHYPSIYTSQKSEDGFYDVSIPGSKLYRFTDLQLMDVVQNADMVNGAYFLITRIRTNSQYTGKSSKMIHEQVDSLLYENIPGKILKKEAIVRNGFKGWDIQNRTRRGDNQRYQVFVTPFEVIVFKMSGVGEFVTEGTEAEKFFASIKLNEYKAGLTQAFTPKTGGFEAKFPHEPSVILDRKGGLDRLEYAANDGAGNSFIVMQKSVHLTNYIEEDSFDLNLLEESYAYSPFIEKQLSRNWTKHNGYPALEANYKHNDGSFSRARFILRGPVNYVVAGRYTKDEDKVKEFINSFTIKPFIYPEAKLNADTLLAFTAEYPQFEKVDSTDQKTIDNWMKVIKQTMQAELDANEEHYNPFEKSRSKMIGTDSIGERIYVDYYPPGIYEFVKDSFAVNGGVFGTREKDESPMAYRSDRKFTLPNGTHVRERELIDTGSSRMILWRVYDRNGHHHSVYAVTDTLSERSVFLKRFFETFTPADTLKGESLFKRKTDTFFEHFFSSDSALVKQARKNLTSFRFDSLDVAPLKKAIERVNWKTKNYLSTKVLFIEGLGKQRDPSVVPYLRDLYFKIGDTTELQEVILSCLLGQKTDESFKVYKELMLTEPPISGNDYYEDRDDNYDRRKYTGDEIVLQGPWDGLYDSLELTAKIFPDFLALLDLDDYEFKTRELLVELVDSNKIQKEVYESKFIKFYNDAKQALKKQLSEEDEVNMRKLAKTTATDTDYDDEDITKPMMGGNGVLSGYAVLLLPFWDKNPGVPQFFSQLMKTKDERLLFNTTMLLLRNNKPVNDTLFQHFAKSDDFRYELFYALQNMKKEKLFPASYRSQEKIVRSLLLDYLSYNTPDSIVFLEKLQTTFKGKKGYMYFYKVRPKKDDNYWNLVSLGLQPLSADSVNRFSDMDFFESENRRLDDSKPLKTQFQTITRELMNMDRPTGRKFYEARNNKWRGEFMGNVDVGGFGD